MLALVFAIVKINRVIYPLQAFFVSFLGTPILVQLMLRLIMEFHWLWKPWINNGRLPLKNINNAIPAAAFAIVAFALAEAACWVKPFSATILSVNPGEVKLLVVLVLTRTEFIVSDYSNLAIVATPTLINSTIGLTKGLLAFQLRCLQEVFC